MQTKTETEKQISQSQGHHLTRLHKGFFIVDKKNKAVVDFVPYAKVEPEEIPSLISPRSTSLDEIA